MARCRGSHDAPGAGLGDRPRRGACADIASCVDVLDHVADAGAVAGEIARVLKPGGLFLSDTINRTRFSKLVAIKLAQDWAMTAFMPPGLHDWNQFITPAELRSALARHHLREDGLTGLKPGVSPPGLIRLMRQLKKSRLSCGELGSRAAFARPSPRSASWGNQTQSASAQTAARFTDRRPGRAAAWRTLSTYRPDARTPRSVATSRHAPKSIRPCITAALRASFRLRADHLA